MRDWRGGNIKETQLGSLRKHQAQLLERAQKIAHGLVKEKLTVLMATPGAGKTLAASIFAHVLLRAGIVDRVIIVVPRNSLREQFAEGFTVKERGLPLRLARVVSNISDRTLFDKAGIVTTYQAIVDNDGRKFVDAAKHCRTLVIFDEIHHLCEKEGAAWRRSARTLFNHATHVLAMSGNLGRWDKKAIPFIEYDADKRPLKHVIYDRKMALKERAIIPTFFQLLDADTEFFHKGREHEVELSGASTEQEKKALGAALSSLEFQDRTLSMAFASWLQYRRSYYPSQLIIICETQKMARGVVHRMRIAHPTLQFALAISEEKDAHKHLARFRSRTAGDVLVTCEMAHEGLDAPWATHLLHLSATRSFPWVEQAFARITRFNAECGVPWEKQAATIIAPNDTDMRAIVAQLDVQQDDAARMQAERHGTAGLFHRSDFRPISATPTTVDLAGESGIYPPDIQEEMRDMMSRYHGIEMGMSGDALAEIAAEFLRLKRSTTATAAE